MVGIGSSRRTRGTAFLQLAGPRTTCYHRGFVSMKPKLEERRQTIFSESSLGHEVEGRGAPTEPGGSVSRIRQGKRAPGTEYSGRKNRFRV